MGIFEHFPYTNFHNLNLDWLIKTVKSNSEDIEKLDSKASISDYKFTYENGEYHVDAEPSELVSAFQGSTPCSISYKGICTTVATITSNPTVGAVISFDFILGGNTAYDAELGRIFKAYVLTLSVSESGTITATQSTYYMTPFTE